MLSVGFHNIAASYKMLQALPAARLAALANIAVMFTRLLSVTLLARALLPFGAAAWQQCGRWDETRTADAAVPDDDLALFDEKLGVT